MTDIQAAIGLAQLNQIDDFLFNRILVINSYHKHLKDVLQFPIVPGAAPWLFTGLAPSEYEVLEPKFKKRGIEIRPMFVPMHHLPMYTQSPSLFRTCDRMFEYGISLPTYPDLTESDVEYISKVTQEVLYVVGRRTFAR